MKKKSLLIVCCIICILFTFNSCKTTAGAGGVNTGIGVSVSGQSHNSYNLIPVGDRITYTIDISTHLKEKTETTEHFA